MSLSNDISIKVLPAFNGDAILISYGNEPTTNILVDTGTRRSYSKGVLRQELVKICYIDLLILTHVDDDHIGGILAYYEDPVRAPNIFRKIWFNSGSVVNNWNPGFQPPSSSSGEIPILPTDQLDMGVSQGKTLEKAFIKEGNWAKELLFSGQSIPFHGANISFLSPELTDLITFAKGWRIENNEMVDMASRCDYDLSIDELVEKNFVEHGSLANKTSMAFIFEYNGIRILLMGDAFPSVIAKNLEKAGYSGQKRCKFDYIKISHHGSRSGMSPALLEMLDCNNFIISTDGKNGHPTKECLARIIASRAGVTNLYFNYDSDSLRHIFSEVDHMKYHFRIFFLPNNQEPYTIKTNVQP